MPKPIFIVGVPRSGTTLLVNLIGMHPELAPIFETRFLRNLLRHCEDACRYLNRSRRTGYISVFADPWLRGRFTKQSEVYKKKVVSLHAPGVDYSSGRRNEVPFDRQIVLYTLEELVRENDRWIESLLAGPTSETTVYQGARELVATLFSTHAARMEKGHWVNKTPGLLNHLQYLPKLFPDAKCMHIVRDGRDVAVSTVSMHWGPTTVRESARRWKELLTDARKQVHHRPLHYMELRYEDLVHSPVEVSRRLFSFLEVDADLAKILSHFKIYTDSLGTWKVKWARRERKAFADEAGDLLIELGYEKDYAWVDQDGPPAD